MAGSAGLLQKLADITTSIDDRCTLALQLFTSNEVPIPRKEEVIFHWVTEQLKTGDSVQTCPILDFIINCFSHPFSKNLAYGWLSPNWTDSFITELIKFVDRNPQSIEKFARCLFSLLKVLHFDRYLRGHIDVYINLIYTFIELLLNKCNLPLNEEIKYLSDILHHLSNMKNVTFYKQQFEIETIKKLYIPLVCLYEKCISQDKIGLSKNVSKQLIDSLSKVMFADCANPVVVSTNLKKFIYNQSDEDNEDFSFITLLFTLKMKAQECIENGRVLFFTFFTELPPFKKLSDKDILDTCIVISSFIKKPAFETNEVCEEKTSFYFLVYENIVTVLSEFLVTPSTIGQICDQSSWLKKLMKNVLKSSNKSLTNSNLSLLKHIFTLYPMIVDDQVLDTYADYVILKSKQSDDILLSYDLSFEAIFQNYRKSHRIPKFIFQLLFSLSNLLTSPDRYDRYASLLLLDVFPHSVTEKFSISLKLLQSGSTTSALDKLYFFLNKFVIFLQDSESKIDNNRVLLGEILCEIYICFLNGARLADQNVPEIIRQKHQENMSDLSKLLSHFGKALLTRKHNQRLMLAYLRLCLTWGEIELMMVRYVDARIRVPKQTDTSAANLVYIHSYLSDYHWNLIAQRVINFGLDECKDALHSLILQKIQALPLLEDEISGIYTDGEDKDGPRSIAARYLLNNARLEWFVKNVDSILPELEPDEVLKFAKTFVRQCLHDSFYNEDENLVLPPICEKNAQLVFAMALYIFYDCGKKLSKFKVKYTKRILKKLDYEQLIGTVNQLFCSDNDKLKPLVADLGSEVTSMWKENIEPADFDFSILKTNVDILTALPLKYLSPENRTILSSIFFAIFRDISSSNVQNESNRQTFHSLLNLVFCILQSKVYFPTTIEWTEFILWLNENSLDYKHRKELLNIFLEVAVSKAGWIQPFVESLILLKKKEISKNKSIPTHLADLLSDLMNVLSNSKRAEKRKGSTITTLNKIRKKGFNDLSENFESIVDQLSPSILLNSYTLALETVLQGNNEANIKGLVTYIEKFITTALKSNENDISSRRFLRTLVVHRKALRQHVTTEILLDIWKAEMINPSIDGLKEIFDASFSNELDKILSNSKAILHSFINQKDFDAAAFKKVCFTCSALLSVDCFKTAQLQKDLKLETRQKFLNYVFSKLSDKLHSWQLNKIVLNRENKLLLLQVLSSVILVKQVKFDGQTLDFCLDAVSTFAEDTSVCTVSIDILFTLLSRRSSLIMDCLPAFLQRYQSIVKAIASNSDINNSVKENDIQLHASYAYKIEKLTCQMEKNTKDFSRIAPFLIADFILIFQKWTIHKLVKAHFMNCVFTFIRMCDRNSMKFLSTNLPYSSLEIFKHIEQDFEKSFKYQGKV